MAEEKKVTGPAAQVPTNVTIIQRTPFWKLVASSFVALLLVGIVLGSLVAFVSRAEATVEDIGVWGAAKACPDVLWIGARGSGQQPGMGPQAWTAYQGFKSRLGDRVVVTHTIGFVELPYTAAGIDWEVVLTDPSFYIRSRDNGVLNVNVMMEKIRTNCGRNTQIVLAGYSQGADVAHRATAVNGYSSVNLRAVVLLSDPTKDPRDTSIARKGNGWRWGGILGGQRVGAGHPTVSVCVAGDIVCDFNTAEGIPEQVINSGTIHGSESYNGLAWIAGQWAADQVLPHLTSNSVPPTTAVLTPKPTATTTTAPRVADPQTPVGRLGVADTCRYDPLPCQGANLRRAPVYSGDIIASMPQGHVSEIACQVRSTRISDSRGYSSTVWNKTSYRGTVGWVSDVWSGRKGWLGPDCNAAPPVTTQPPVTVTTQPPRAPAPGTHTRTGTRLNGRVHGQQNCSGVGAGAPMGRFIQTFKVPDDVRVIDEVTAPLGNHDGADLAIYRGATRLAIVRMPRNVQDGEWKSFSIRPVDVEPGETLELVLEQFAAWNGTARGFNVYVLLDDVMPGVGYRVSNSCSYADGETAGFAPPMIVTGSTPRDWYGRIRGWNR